VLVVNSMIDPSDSWHLPVEPGRDDRYLLIFISVATVEKKAQGLLLD